MLSAEMNERLTRVGPGTPGGELFRRYWHPVGAVAQLEADPVVSVRLLGEDLTLYRDRNGGYGLIGSRCAHRLLELKHGIPEANGLRCPYHGWVYNAGGQCIEQPAEPKDSTYKDTIKIPAYPVREVGGMLFAYLGPAPVPELPIWDRLAMTRGFRTIASHVVQANWLQCQENAPDYHHTVWLHGIWYPYVLSRAGLTDPADPRVALGLGFQSRYRRTKYDRFEHGIVSRAMFEGTDETSALWTIGQHVLFPHVSSVSVRQSGLLHMFLQFRVPMDDTRTHVLTYHVFDPGDGVPVDPQDEVPYFEVPIYTPGGDLSLDAIQAQDSLAMEAQGAIVDRTQEHLATSDAGVVLLRRLLIEQMDKVERGEDPINVFRDPAAAAHIHIPTPDTAGSGTNGFGVIDTADYVRGTATAGLIVEGTMVNGPISEIIEDLAERAAAAWRAKPAASEPVTTG